MNEQAIYEHIIEKLDRMDEQLRSILPGDDSR